MTSAEGEALMKETNGYLTKADQEGHLKTVSEGARSLNFGSRKDGKNGSLTLQKEGVCPEGSFPAPKACIKCVCVCKFEAGFISVVIFLGICITCFFPKFR